MGNKGKIWLEVNLPMSDDNQYNRIKIGAEAEVDVSLDVAKQMEEFTNICKIGFESLDGNLVERLSELTVMQDSQEYLKDVVKRQGLEVKKLTARLESTISQLKKMMESNV